MTKEDVVELCAESAHDGWMQGKLDQGITSRPSEDGIEQMVPYKELPEHLKDLDRMAVLSVVETLIRNNLLKVEG